MELSKHGSFRMVEPRGIEPLTSAMPLQRKGQNRSVSGANDPGKTRTRVEQAVFCDPMVIPDCVTLPQAPTGKPTFWLSQRRDGASDRWMVTWYDPVMRCQRYRSTRTTDRAKAEQFLAKFEGSTSIVPGQRYIAPRPPLFVYFVAGDVGAVKIGSAIDVNKRLRDLQCGSPIPLRILATAPGGLKVERAYHRQFAAHRLHGEWFERCPEIEAEIARLKAA